MQYTIDPDDVVKEPFHLKLGTVIYAGWLVVWLFFGILGAHETSRLKTDPAGDAALAVFYTVAGVFGLWMMLRRSVITKRPGRLYAPLALSLAGLGIVALLSYERKTPPAWVDTLVAVAGFLVLSACAAAIGAIISWRRYRADRERHRRETEAWERRRLLERTASNSINQLIADLESPPIENDADLLPPRLPKR